MTARPRTTEGQLGTFIGVFTPTLLTILGVIMYLRVGWLVGNMGLLYTLSIVVLANLVTLATTLSFSSIATNRRIGIGGAYNIISRNLGLEIGGAIGLPLFLSQAFSVTLYAFGLAESVRFIWPGIPVAPAAFVLVLGIGLLASKGSAIALKAQLPLLVLVAVSLAALLAGSVFNPISDPPPMAQSTGEIEYWVSLVSYATPRPPFLAGPSRLSCWVSQSTSPYPSSCFLAQTLRHLSMIPWSGLASPLSVHSVHCSFSPGSGGQSSHRPWVLC